MEGEMGKEHSMTNNESVDEEIKKLKLTGRISIGKKQGEYKSIDHDGVMAIEGLACYSIGDILGRRYPGLKKASESHSINSLDEKFISEFHNTSSGLAQRPENAINFIKELDPEQRDLLRANYRDAFRTLELLIKAYDVESETYDIHLLLQAIQVAEGEGEYGSSKKSIKTQYRWGKNYHMLDRFNEMDTKNIIEPMKEIEEAIKKLESFGYIVTERDFTKQ